jgi:dTDP-4-amino-4,6-dideoxygalactose transaminase
MKNLTIQKEAKSLSAGYENRIYTSSARAAFAHILDFLNLRDKKKLLVPAYIGLSNVEGSGVFDPITGTNTKVDFYEVDGLLQPDLIKLEEQLATNLVGCVFLIHYFGIPQVNVQKFVDLCHKYDAYVIEDCAHTIQGDIDKSVIGRTGDFSIFSMHKSTPTADGGFFLHKDQSIKFQEMLPERKIQFDTLDLFSQMDLNKISNIRIGNYRKLLDFVHKIDGISIMYPDIEDDIIPLNFPILVANNKREALYFDLLNKGIHATALYHRLIPEITEHEYPSSHYVSNNILNIPTHQDIDNDHFDWLCKSLRMYAESIIGE